MTETAGLIILIGMNRQIYNREVEDINEAVTHLIKLYGQHVSIEQQQDFISFLPQEMIDHYTNTYLDIIFYQKLQNNLETSEVKSPTRVTATFNKPEILNLLAKRIEISELYVYDQ